MVSRESVRRTFSTVANIGSHIIPIDKKEERENLIRKIRKESDQVYPWGQDRNPSMQDNRREVK